MVLLRYARFYKMLYELPAHERPTDALLEQDDELDRWFEGFVRQRERDAARAAKGQVTGRRMGQHQVPMHEGF